MQYVDQIGRTVTLEKIPRKIISLVPSQTELLYYLGLNEEVVGITKFCIHPESWHQSKKQIGGTKQLNLDTIRMLSPDLVIANKEENDRHQVEELSKEFPVWVSDVNTLQDAYDMILAVGILVHKKPEALTLVHEIRQRFQELITHRSPITSAYLIWRSPWMTVGGDTFIHDMMACAGFSNVFSHQKRYPVIEADELRQLPLDLLMLSSEPYPFNKKHLNELQSILPDKKLLLVDGEMFSWYGSRLLFAPAYFKQLQQQVLSLKHAAGK